MFISQPRLSQFLRRLTAGRVFPVLGILLLLPLATAADWPQLLGPQRNGVYDGGDLADSWPAAGPPVVWEKRVGRGFSNPVVANRRLILFHRIGDEEVVEALNAETGEAIWSYRYPTAYHDDFGFDPGPRASPVVVGGQVYTFGAEGMLTCLEFASGRKIWSIPTHEKFGVRKGYFGAAATPLILGSRLFLNVGGREGGIVAFDKDTGRVLWTATEDEASYSSAIVANLDGKDYIVFFTREGLAGLEPATGRVAFQQRWRSRSDASVNAAIPLMIENHIFLSASYGTGATLLKVSEESLTPVWSSEDSLTNHYATSVRRADYLYGYHGRQEYGPSFRCIEWKTGDVVWSEDGFGAGTVTLAGDRLLILREDGELLMAQASAKAFEPLLRSRILSGTVRAYPALANGLLYARNEDTLVCVRLGE